MFVCSLENHDKLVEENKNLQLQLLEQREENRSLIGRLQSNTKVTQINLYLTGI